MPNISDPNEYLASKAAQQSPQNIAPQDGAQATGMQKPDPRAYLASKGQQTSAVVDNPAPAPQAIQQNMNSQGFETLPGTGDQSPGVADAIGNAASKGFSIGGLGRDLAPLVAAIPSTETDKQLGRDYFDRVLMNKSEMDKSAEQSQKLHPGLSFLVQGITSIPKTIALSNVLSSIGVTTARGQAGIQGGLEGLTQSKKDGVLNTAKDVSKSALLAYGLGTLADGYSAFLKQTSSPAVDELGNVLGEPPTVEPINADRVGVIVNPRPNGDFEIKYGGGFSDAMKLGKAQGKVLMDPEARAQVADEVANVFGSETNPGKIPQLIDQTQKDINIVRDGVLKDKGALSTNVESAFKKANDRLMTFDTQGDPDKMNAVADLSERLKTLETDLATKSPTGSLKDVPLLATFKQKQDLGNKIFGSSQLYRKASDARNIVQGLWSDLGKAASVTDPQVKTLTDALSGLFKMQDNAINGASKIEALTNPSNGAMRLAYRDFIKPFKDLDPDVRASLMPKLQEYLATELPDTLNKAAVMKAIHSTKDAKGGLGWVLNKLYLNKGVALNAARGLGALSRKGMPISAGDVAGQIKSSVDTVNSALMNNAPQVGSGLGVLSGNVATGGQP